MTFDPTSLATLGGALALIGGLVGSSIGIAKAASAGTATLSEDSGQFRNVIVLSSLPMTQSFYGLIILILIITAVVPKLTETGGSGMAVLGIGLIGFMAELFSAIYQGKVGASGIQASAKQPALFGKCFAAVGIVESFALFAFVFALLIM